LVHDPFDLLRVGDVIRYTRFFPHEQEARMEVKREMKTHKWEKLREDRRNRLIGRRRGGDGKTSKRVRVRFVVRQVVSAWGKGLEERWRGVLERRKGDVEAKKGSGKASILEELYARTGGVAPDVGPVVGA
jgi:hypothetical protein